MAVWKYTKFWCFFSVWLVAFFKVNSAEVTNYISANYLENGQMETLVKYNQFSAKEITVINKNQSGLSLRQVSDGKRFLQLVFDEDVVKDCQFILDRDEIEKFLQSFNRRPNLESTSTLVIEGLRDKPLPADMKKWFHFKKLYKICHQKHKEMRTKLRRLKEQEIEEEEAIETYGRFRACLKRVGTTDANLVGNIFFNFVQRKCFTMEPTKVCSKKYHNHEKRKEGKFRKKKDLNSRRTKRNQKKCKKRKPRKAIVQDNLSY